jgi:hypothetical protein
MERNKQEQGVLKNIVVEGTKKLGHKERAETLLAQQTVLTTA